MSTICFKVYPEDRERLDALAADCQRTPSDVLRRLITRAHEAMQHDPDWWRTNVPAAALDDDDTVYALNPNSRLS